MERVLECLVLLAAVAHFVWETTAQERCGAIACGHGAKCVGDNGDCVCEYEDRTNDWAMTDFQGVRICVKVCGLSNTSCPQNTTCTNHPGPSGHRFCECAPGFSRSETGRCVATEDDTLSSAPTTVSTAATTVAPSIEDRHTTTQRSTTLLTTYAIIKTENITEETEQQITDNVTTTIGKPKSTVSGITSEVNIGLLAALAICGIVIISMGLALIDLGRRYRRLKAKPVQPRSRIVYDVLNPNARPVSIYENFALRSFGSRQNASSFSNSYTSATET